MFTVEEIEARVKQQPFIPLRIVTSSGQTFDIYHPGLIMVGRGSITVGIAGAEDPRHYEQQTRVAILHVTALEDLPAPAPPRGDGQP